jgi:hypothetical protein
MLYGAAAALRGTIGSPVPAVEQHAHEQGLARTRSHLNEATFDKFLDCIQAIVTRPYAEGIPRVAFAREVGYGVARS